MLAAASFLMLNSCASVRLKAMTSPPPTAKMRVYVQLISEPFPSSTGTWHTPHEEFVAKNIRQMESFFEKTGIYEVVPASDVEEVLGGQELTYREMERNGWALAREIGKALYAEYAIIIERSIEKNKLSGKDQYLTIVMINTGKGKRFEARVRMDTFDRASPERRRVITRDLYRNVFLSAKQDMLETAVRKSERSEVTPHEQKLIATAPEPKPTIPVPVPEPQKPAPAPVQEQPATAPKPKPVAAAPSPKIKHPEPEIAKPMDEAPLISREKDITAGMDRLVIYDLDAPEQYRTVALILTEVLREELFLLNRFILVNREDLQQVLRGEVALQQSGLIDEKQAVKAGKGLAANQVVTGRLGMLGKTFFLQAKRIDVETFATLGLASARFVKGQEEDVLSSLPGFAKSLAGLH